MKFFISYSRSVKQEVGKVIDLLRAAGHDVWWDGDIPEIADWWATILDEIEVCEVFIFIVSEKSVQSAYCLEELHYATDRNRPILPFVMDDHTRYTIPPEVTPMRNQWFIHDGDPARMLRRIVDSCDNIVWEKYRDRPAARPIEPNTGSGSIVKEFQQAVSLAEEGHFDESIKRFRNVSSLHFQKWGEDCHQWITRIQLYREIAELVQHKSTLKRARDQWTAYLNMYDSDFDPFNITSKLEVTIPASSVSSPSIREISSPPSQITAKQNSPAFDFDAEVTSFLGDPFSPASRIRSIIGDPFDLCNVSAGEFLYGVNKEKRTLPAFLIAKYPVTYSQFQTFIDAEDGFQDSRWWEDLVPKDRHKTKPSGQMWTTVNQPRVNVSWYEAMVFCRWLSFRLSGKYAFDLIKDWTICLPTDEEWEKAASGTDGRLYPWGDEFDETKANTKESGIRQTTPVTQYLTGASPYGVLDMCGNVWEWSFTEHFYQPPELSDENVDPVWNKKLHGGSFIHDRDAARITFGTSDRPVIRDFNVGFRVVVRHPSRGG